MVPSRLRSRSDNHTSIYVLLFSLPDVTVSCNGEVTVEGIVASCPAHGSLTETLKAARTVTLKYTSCLFADEARSTKLAAFTRLF